MSLVRWCVIAVAAVAALLCLLLFFGPGEERASLPPSPEPPRGRPVQAHTALPSPPPPIVDATPAIARAGAFPGRGGRPGSVRSSDSPASAGARVVAIGKHPPPSLKRPQDAKEAKGDDARNGTPVALSAVVKVELAGELNGAKVTARIFPKKEYGFTGETKDGAAPRSAVVRGGRVEVPVLPDGRWVLEVAAQSPGRVVRTKREFTSKNGKTDLGPVKVLPSAGIRARVVDAGGRPVPQAVVVVVREDEDPAQARRLPPGPDGWYLYGDLEAATYHHVVAFGLPEKLEETVRTPASNGEVKDVELRVRDRLVLVRLTLRLPDSAPHGQLEIRKGPIAPRLRPGDREVSGEVLPGTYTFRVTVAGHVGSYSGRLTVPPDGPFVTTLDLAAPKPSLPK